MIKLLNGETYLQGEINALAANDEFYYGHLGKHAVSSSVLRNILDSPNRQLEYLKKQEANSDALMLGKLTHWCWLEPDVFYSQVYSDARGNSKEWKDLVAQHGESNVYKTKFKAIAEWLCRKLDNNEEIRALRKDAEVEVPMVGMMGEVAVRGKADMIKGDTIYDLKTGIVSPEEFARWKVDKMHYDMQCFIYMTLFEDIKHFKFIYINKHTRDIGLIEVPQEVLDRGKEKFRVALQAYLDIFHNRDLDEIEFMLDQHIYHGEAR